MIKLKELKKCIEEMRLQKKTLLISTHIIDSVDMLWDRSLIMQNGTIKANLTRENLEKTGRSLEEVFFDVTENLSHKDMSHPEEETSEEKTGAAD